MPFNYNNIMFPSPCGDMVLKSPSRARKGCRHEGFRPLAGFPYLSFPRRYGGSGEHSEPMGGACALRALLML